jgi:replicative DNA helicase
MARDPLASATSGGGTDRSPPYSEEAERGVLGSILLDAERVMDLCIESQLVAESFFVPSHRALFEVLYDLQNTGGAIDVLTVAERLRVSNRLDSIGGTAFLDQLVDGTPTAAHAEYYIDIVRQRHIVRTIIACARDAEAFCYGSQESADSILGRVEQSFMNITERQHGYMMPWSQSVTQAMEHVETVFATQGMGGVRGVPTGLNNLDHILQGLRPSEMVVLAACPSMGKTALAMNIVQNIALGDVRDHKAHPVGVFSLEMSAESLILRMLCTMAKVSSFHLMGGQVSGREIHGNLMHAASRLKNAPIYLDDTGGLDVLELRARSRRMKKKHNVELIVVDYLQLLHAREYADQGRQLETANISSNLKSMAKELRIPVLVLSQLSRAPDQRDKTGKPKLSDLRDSGAIEQDADVVCMLRRPCKYDGDEEHEDKTLAVVDVAKQRNGPTGEVRLNFQEEHTWFNDRALPGVDGLAEAANFHRGAGNGGERA